MRRRSLAACLAALCCVGVAQAELVERDWLAPSDGLLTLDTQTGREWLDLSQTLLADFNLKPSPGNPGQQFFSDGPDAFALVQSELAAGGLFDGFQVAFADDFVELAENAGIDTTDRDSEQNREAMLALVELVDATRFVTPTIQFSIGVLADECDNGERRACDIIPLVLGSLNLRFGNNQNGFPVTNPAQTVLVSNEYDTVTIDIVGVWLFRVVPEPSGFTGTLLLVSLAATRRRPRRR